VVTFDTFNPLAKSPGANVYKESKRENKKFLMKVSGNQERHLDQMWKESAVLRLLSGYKSVTSTYVAATLPESVSQLCQLRTMVMERVGETNVGDHRINNGGPLDKQFVSSVGIAAINLLETVHSTGLVHGDVHEGNFVFYKSDPAATLRIIDFGRTRPYIDAKTGNHVPLARIGEHNWNPVLLSVGELEGWTVSRRDDLFRLAELLISNTDPIDVNGDEDVLHFKRNRKFSPLVPEGLVQFYKETMDLAFDATPDYNRFRSLIRL
jgi:serine/threonine protein kinase